MSEWYIKETAPIKRWCKVKGMWCEKAIFYNFCGSSVCSKENELNNKTINISYY